jgi:WD40 repeat protein
MSDQAFDPRFESLLREALAGEVARLPLTLGPEHILERGRARRRSSVGSRLHLPRFSMAAGAAVVILTVAAVGLSNLLGRLDSSVASLPTSPADWSRVEVDSAGTGWPGISTTAAGARGLVAVTGVDERGIRTVLFSPDGHDWSQADIPPVHGEYVSVVATDRGFLMTVSEDGAWASENGVDWQHVADDWSGDPDVGGSIVVDVAVGGPGYVAVGNRNKIWHSPDGSDWALAEVPPPPPDLVMPDHPDLVVDILDVAAVGDTLVATGYFVAENGNETGASRDFVLASSDGHTWSAVLPHIGDRAGPLEIAAGPNGFLLIGGPLDGEREWNIWHSTDGQAWQSVGSYDFSSGSDREVRIEDVAATGSGYVAVGLERDCLGCPPQALLWTSVDGRTWSQLADGEPFNQYESGTSLGSVAAYGSHFVVGGQHGGRPAIWISGSDGTQPTTAPDVTAIPEPTAASPTESPSSTDVSVRLGVFAPLAGRIVYSTGSSLWGMDPYAPSPGSIVQVNLADAGAGTSFQPLSWSSDGTKLLLRRTVPRYPGSPVQPPFDKYLYVVHADGIETQVTPEAVHDKATISPDGSRVAFSTDQGLYVVDAEGGEPVRIARQGRSPTFSPDGTRIAYLIVNTETDVARVWVVNVDGSDAHEILADEVALINVMSDLAWSATGDRIASGNSSQQDEAIYTFAADGSAFTKVITGGSSPFWSPDGSQIAYTLPWGWTTNEGEPIGEQSPRLAIANADGSDVRQFDFAQSGPWHPGTLP